MGRSALLTSAPPQSERSKDSAAPAALPGVMGAQGVPGPAGGFDPNKVSYVQGTTFERRAGEPGDRITTVCPSGSKALSGGWVDITGLGKGSGNRSYDSGGSWTVRSELQQAQFTKRDR